MNWRILQNIKQIVRQKKCKKNAKKNSKMKIEINKMEMLASQSQ